MRNFIGIFICVILWGNAVRAQQIKGDFDRQTDWGVQTSFSGPDPSFTEMGITPQGWAALNVTQMGLNFPLVFSEKGRDGAGKSVKMMNRKLGAFGIGANSPSYMTLGKTWVYADILGVMSQLGDKKDPDDSNGGSLDGIDFTFRPDSIVGFFKRSHAEQNPQEIAQMIVYSWVGTCKSYSPVGDGLDPTEELSKEALFEREVDILGIQNGGKPANGITLIGKQIHTINGNLAEWTRIAAPIEYLRSENPMKLNVILSSADYFNRPNIGEGNALWADDIRFIYNSKLKSITIDGKDLDSFDEDVMEYILPASDASKAIVAKAFGKNAKVTIGKLTDSKRVITVEDQTAAGVKIYNYTLIYKGSPAKLTWKQISVEDYIYGNSIDIKPISTNTEGKFSYEISNIDLAEIIGGDTLRLKGVGEVKIIARQEAADNYSPSVSEPLVINVRKAPLTISVKDIERVYNYSEDEFEFIYEGLKNDDENAIDKVFTVQPTVSIPKQTLPNGKVLETSKGVYVGEYVLTASNAVAANYEISYKPGMLKVTPAPKIEISAKSIRVNEGVDIPALTVNYRQLIGEDNLDPTLVFSIKPILKTTAVKGSPAGEYDILFESQGTLTDAAKKNYQGISFQEKGLLSIEVVKAEIKFEDVVAKVEGLPLAQYDYVGYTDILGKILVYDKIGNLMDTNLLSFSTSSKKAFGIDKNGEFRLMGDVEGATGDVDITVTIKETKTTKAVSKIVAQTKILKKQAVIRPKDFALSSIDFTNNTEDEIPFYIESKDFLDKDLASSKILGAFTVCPTLNIETPDGILKLEEEGGDYKYMFKQDIVEKLHKLPMGKYPFTLEGGESTQYDYTFDNGVKGFLFIPEKSKVEIKGIDNLTYGRKESFKLEIKANDAAIKEFTVTENHIEATATAGEYKVLTPGIDTLTFVIPATQTTVEETYTQTITVNKALLTMTPLDIIQEEGKITIPKTYAIKYEGFVNGDDETSLNTLPIAICQVVETAKFKDVFTIFLTGAEDDQYDFIYNDGKFTIVQDESSIDRLENETSLKIYASEGTLFVYGNDEALPVAVYTVQGTLIGHFDGSQSSISAPLIRNSIYIVKVGNYATLVTVR